MKSLFAYGGFGSGLIRAFAAIILLCSFQGTNVTDEYTIKGMFIYNFTKYIDWSGSKQGSNFVIAVLGHSEIEQSLQQIAANKKVNNKNIEIRMISNPAEATDCQIIFISRSSNNMLRETIEKLGSKGILIVTEDKDMALKGATINIINVDGKFKFELNETAARRDGLKIATQLEALAIHVK